MSFETATPTPQGTDWADDEIDLRKYIDVLIKRWREILVFTVLVVVATAIGVLSMRAVLAPTYKATAKVAIVRTQTAVNFDDRFRTQSDQVGGQEINSRRSALVDLATSSTIAEQVIAGLGDELTEEQRNPAVLSTMVEASLAEGSNRSVSDLINIEVTALTPERAAAIANAWARTYVQEVNQIYGQVPDEMLVSVEMEQAQAQKTYEAAQAQLEDFLASSRIDSLTRQIEENRNIIQSLQNAKTDSLNTYVSELVASYQRIVSAYLQAQTENQLLAFENEQGIARDAIQASFDAYRAATVDTVATQTDRDTALLRLYYDQWLQTTANLTTARALKEQLKAGGESEMAGTALAAQLLKLQLVSNGSRLPVSMADLYNPTQSTAIRVTETTTTDADGINTRNRFIDREPVGADGTDGTPPILQLQMESPQDITMTALTDEVEGLVAALETQLGDLEKQIAALNRSLLSGERYDLSAQTVPDESALVQRIEQQYPELFKTGLFTAIGNLAAADSSLTEVGQEQAALILEINGTQTLPGMNTVDAPLLQAIAKLEDELSSLQSQLEAENARNLQFSQQRDMNWETYKALSNKLAELNLARAAADSEVRFAAGAVPPSTPIPGTSLTLSVALAGAVGLLLAVFLAFLLEYLGKPPLFTRPRAT